MAGVAAKGGIALSRPAAVALPGPVLRTREKIESLCVLFTRNLLERRNYIWDLNYQTLFLKPTCLPFPHSIPLCRAQFPSGIILLVPEKLHLTFFCRAGALAKFLQPCLSENVFTFHQIKNSGLTVFPFPFGAVSSHSSSGWHRSR